MLSSAGMTALDDRQIGDLEVSPSRRLIVGPEGKANLEPLVMQLLLLLAEADDRVVSRKALFDSLWSSSEIGDASLNRLAASLRRALVSVGTRMQLETVPRAGYRLTSDIREPGAAPSPTLPIERRGLLAAGAGMIIAGAGLSWWLLKPDPQQELGRQLATRGERMLNFDVPEHRKETVEILSRAAALRPSDARVWGLLAYARARLVTGGEGTVAMNQVLGAEDAIKRARTLQPDEANAELATLVLRRSARDWSEADGVLRGILKRDPANVRALSWLVGLTQSSGHAQESWDLNERQIELDPLSPEPLHRRAIKHWIFNRVDDADRVIDPLLRLWPSHPWVWNARFMIYAFTGRPRAALSMLKDPASRPPRLTSRLVEQWTPSVAALERPTSASRVAAREANLAAARNSPGQAVYAVLALSALNEVDAAFEVATGLLLSRGQVVTRSGRSEPLLVSTPAWRQTQWLFTPPTLSLRLDPRFTGFAEQIGLAAYWRKRGGPDPSVMRR